MNTATLTHQGLNIVLCIKDVKHFFPTMSSALIYCQRHNINAHFSKPTEPCSR